MMRLLVIIFGSVFILLSSNPTAVNSLDPLETDEEVFQADRLSAEAQTEYPNGVNVIPGDAETDYPVYHTIPKTSFSCAGRIPGFYADVEARCQAWHNCDTDSRMQSFLCPNGTIYSQTKRVCEWWYNVNCNPIEVNRYYEQNRDLFISPRDQFPIPEVVESAKQGKNGLIANSGPTKVRPQQQQQQQNFNQNQGSRSPPPPPPQQQNFNQQNFNQGSRPPPPPPPQQQQQQQNFNQNQGSRPPAQQQQNYNQGPPPTQQQNFNQQNFNQNQGSRPQPQQQQNFNNQGPQQQQQRQQQQRPSQPQQVPSHLSAIVQAATGAVPQTTVGRQQSQQQPRRHPGDGQNFNRPNEFQNGGNQNRGNQVNRNQNQVQQQPQDNGQNYQQDRQQQQFQSQENQQNNQRGQQQQQYRQNSDYNQNQRSQGNRQNSDNNPDQRQQQRRPVEDRPVQPVQSSRQQQQQQPAVPVNRAPVQQEPRPNNNKPTPSPTQTFFIPPQMRFRHSTPRKHNIKFNSRLQEDESRERQIPSESQQQGFPYAQFVPQTYGRNFNELIVPGNQYIIQAQPLQPQPQQFLEPSTTTLPLSPPPQPPQQVPHRLQKSRPTEFIIRSPPPQQQQAIPAGRQVPQRQNLQRSQQPSSISNPRVVPSRESYQPVSQSVLQKERQEIQRPTPATPTTAAPVRRLPPPPEPATTYRPNPAAARIVVKARLENKHQVHEVRDSRPRDLPIYRAVAVQYPAPLDSSEEEEAAIHSSYTAGGKTYGTKQ